jgi:hypothetical protein
MRRRIVIGIAAGLLAVGGGSAFAYPGAGNSPGNNPDHPAWFGLCKAYERNAQPRRTTHRSSPSSTKWTRRSSPSSATPPGPVGRCATWRPRPLIDTQVAIGGGSFGARHHRVRAGAPLRRRQPEQHHR